MSDLCYYIPSPYLSEVFSVHIDVLFSFFFSVLICTYLLRATSRVGRDGLALISHARSFEIRMVHAYDHYDCYVFFLIF